MLLPCVCFYMVPAALGYYSSIIAQQPGTLPFYRPTVCSFKEYVNLSKRELFPKHAAVEHWAKIEPAELNKRELASLQRRLGNRYPIAQFNSYRKQLDPKGVLSNEFVDLVLVDE